MSSFEKEVESLRWKGEQERKHRKNQFEKARREYSELYLDNLLFSNIGRVRKRIRKAALNGETMIKYKLPEEKFRWFRSNFKLSNANQWKSFVDLPRYQEKLSSLLELPNLNLDIRDFVEKFYTYSGVYTGEKHIFLEIYGF